MSEIRVTYSGLIALLTAFAGVGFGLIFMVVVTRTLSIEEYGTWGLIIGLLAYGSILDSLASVWVIRETARGVKSGKTATLLGTGIFSTAGVFVYIIAAFIVGLGTDIDQNILLFAVILLPTKFLMKNLNSMNQGWKPQILSYAYLISESIKIPSVLIFLLFLDMGVSGVILSLLMASIGGCTVHLILGRTKLKNKINIEFVKKWFKLSWIPLYGKIASVLLATDVIVFSIIVGSVEGVALMTAALVIANLVSFAKATSSSVESKLLEGGARGYLRENVSLLFYFIFPLAALSFTFAKPGLFALNPIYEIAVPIVIFMTLRVLFFSLSDVFVEFLRGIEKVDLKPESTFKDFIKSKLFSLPTIRIIHGSFYLIILVILLLLERDTVSQLELVIHWAIISLATTIPFTIYLYLMVKKNFSFSLDISRIFKFLLASIVIFGSVFFLSEEFLEYNNDVFQFIPNLLLLAGIGVGGYLLITYLIDFKIRSLVSSVIGEIIKRKK